MRRNLFFSSLLPAIALSAALPATAQSNDEIAAKLKAREFQEADKLARKRLAADESDEAAYNYLALAALSGDANLRTLAIPNLETCIEKRPEASVCHHRLGQLYGMSALSAGMIGGLKYATKVKGALSRAVELNPANFEARRDLIQFYMQAPGMVGGSSAKAKEHADAHGKLNAAQGQLLQLDIHINKKEFDQAERILAGIALPSEEAVRLAYRSAHASLGFAQINAGEFARARAVFERAAKQFPDYAVAYFGIGRAHLETKQLDAAIEALEKSLQLDPTLGAGYRLGIAYQLKGNKSKAIESLENFLAAKPPRTGKAADDAKARLTQLKASA